MTRVPCAGLNVWNLSKTALPSTERHGVQQACGKWHATNVSCEDGWMIAGRQRASARHSHGGDVSAGAAVSAVTVVRFAASA
ncbi:hypothetical protein BRO15_09105 [Xanthomonas oryzae pv. oryzae]|nr:hypothetical protein BRO15_09105 [Xanthomonas oryzae pv. oryzae]